MTTDWILMRRAAAELERALRGGRVTDAGLLDDGRFAVRFGGLRGRAALTLAVDVFGTPPLVALENAVPALAGDPGWTRAVSAAVRGMRVSAVRARRADRLIALVLGTASRFGVTQEARLVLELVPRYGNVVLVRDGSVIAAAKQFSPAENETRSVQAGHPYQAPPLPRATLDFAGFAAAVAAGDAAARVRALGGARPELPRILAASLVAEAAAQEVRAADVAAWLDERAAWLLAAADGEPAIAHDLHVYRDGGRLAALHVFPLAQFAGLAHARAPELLALWRDERAAGTAAPGSGALERRRSALVQRIAKRSAATASERAALGAKIADAATRDALREAGDALHTHAHEVPAGAAIFVPPSRPEITIALDPELDAKANAQRYFARYRKASDALPHLERRAAALAARAAALENFAFEAERADPAALDEITVALDVLEGKRAKRRNAGAAKPRALLRVERPSGARIIVGRSPRENDEVTFRIARPDDLWFHARNVPGSHVVLQAPPGAAAQDEDVDAAANLAAAHSRAARAPRVEVDFTQRKYVRKQRDGAPGLVWYTNARTRVGDPAAV